MALERIPGNRPLMLLTTTALSCGLFLTAHTGLQRARSIHLSLEEEIARDRQLNEHAQTALPRLLRKQRISERVIAGQMSLLEAAAHFRAFDHQPPAFHWDTFRLTHRGDTDEEKHCR